jgi:hypothetical protein
MPRRHERTFPKTAFDWNRTYASGLPVAELTLARGIFVRHGGRSGYGGGRTMMRNPQQPSLHMAIGGPDRSQAFDRRRTVLSRRRPVVGVPGSGRGRKGRRCEQQTG